MLTAIILVLLLGIPFVFVIFGLSVILRSAPWLLVAVALFIIVPDGDHGHEEAEAACHVTDPCWNWSRMGTPPQRPVTLRDGRVLLRVGPCQFRELVRRRKVDWSRSQHLRGDRNALKNGCKA